MRLITLGSASTGYGKSFVTVTLGVALARRGVRTCLVDLDLGTADLHLMTGILDASGSVHELLRGGVSSLEDVMLAVPGVPRLHLVAGPRETVCVTGLASEEIGRLGSEMRRLPVEVVIADLQAGISQQILDLFLLGDQHWVAATNEDESLEDAQRYLRLARLRRTARGTASQLGSRPRVYTSLDDLVRDMNALRQEIPPGGDGGFAPGLIVNRCRPDQPDEEQRLLEGLLNPGHPTDDPPLIGMIPEDEVVASAEMMTVCSPGGPATPGQEEMVRSLTHLSRGSAAFRAIDEIAAAIADDLAGEIPRPADLAAPLTEAPVG